MSSERDHPQRTCIACRKRDDQSALIRLVRRDTVVVDATSPRLPGRGAYVHPSCVDLLAPRKAIRRTFGAAAELDPELMTRAAGWIEQTSKR